MLEQNIVTENVGDENNVTEIIVIPEPPRKTGWNKEELKHLREQMAEWRASFGEPKRKIVKMEDNTDAE